jgi:predicted ATPase/transcriptional regulator with XRE-family HTH domain
MQQERRTVDAAEQRPRWNAVLRAIREARGVTQEGFAAHLGYGLRTVRRWERGEGVPDARAEQALLAYCHEHALFRRLDFGSAGLVDVTPEFLRVLLAEARIEAAMTSTDLHPALPAPVADSTPRTNLPAVLSSFIGRERELTEVSALVATSRLLTLTGSGGVGKTRLALAVGAAVRGQFPDGVWFVDLAPLRDAALLASAAAEACGVPETAGEPPTVQLVRFLYDKRLLLILDNFEHLVDAASQLTEILSAAPGVRALVTSRAALRRSGEQEYPVLPLPVPNLTQHEAAATLAQYPAVRLFIERMRSIRPDRALDDASMPVVAAICARLDGLPLAIELAAARTRLFPPGALLARLDRRLPLLAGGPRDLPQRQQTLRDAIIWSYDLLSPAEQRLFRRLAVFVGGCSVEAAEAVCEEPATAHQGCREVQTSTGLGIDIVDGLASLVDKSLLYQDEGPDAEPRFTMLETIREFALEQLAASGEERVSRERHARYFLQMVESSGPVLLGTGPHPFRLAAEQGNIRAALRWLVAGG